MNRLGVWSASALCVIGVAYVVTLAVGFAAAGFAKPIVDPVLAVMEILTDGLRLASAASTEGALRHA